MAFFKIKSFFIRQKCAIFLLGLSFAIISCGKDKALAIKHYECPKEIAAKNIVCGEIIVPENYNNKKTNQIKLQFVQVKSQNPNSKNSPVFYLHGGPGGGVMDDLGDILHSQIGAQLIAKNEDWIFFDQRGTGKSTPLLDCGDLMLNDAGPQSNEVLHQLEDCKAKLQQQKIDFAQYDSVNVVKDIVSISDALKYEKIRLLGYSYGTRVAMEAMRQIPKKIESTILDSTWPPDAAWTSFGPNWVSNGVKQVLNKCQSDKNCAANNSNIMQDFQVFMGKLNAAPIKFKNHEINGQIMAQYLMDALYSAQDIETLPFDLNNFIKGDFTKLIDYTKGIGGGYSELQHLAVLCNEELPFENPIIMLDNAKNDPIAYAIAQTMQNYFKACKIINSKPINANDNAPLKSDIPSLLLSAEIDPGCPSELSQSAVKQIKNGQYFLFNNRTHGILESSICGRKLARDFLDNSRQKLNAACIKDDMPKINFTNGNK